jgi:hypothetical protein
VAPPACHGCVVSAGLFGWAESATELCDGVPSFVEPNGGTWCSGSFSPWSSEIVGEAIRGDRRTHDWRSIQNAASVTTTRG